MSAIGEYIHLKKENYDKYGTARVGGSPQLLIDSYNAQKEINLTRIKNFENKIDNTILIELKSRIEENYNENKQAREIAENHVNFNKGMTNFQQEFRAKLIAEIPNVFGVEGVSVRLNKSNMKMNKEPINLSNAKRYRANAISAIKTANDNFAAGKPIQKNTITAIINNTDMFFKELGMIEGIDILWPRGGWKNQDTLSALKGILELAPLGEMNQSALSGAFGEALVNMAADTMRTLSGKELAKAIEEALSTGEVRSSFSIDESMITPQVQQVFQEETGLNLYQIHSSQNKVDASITIKDIPVEASVKAYTPKGNVINAHLQDVSLLSTLAATQLQFANHWISLHSYGASNSGMDEALSEQIMYEALSSGNLLKQDVSVADTFVAIDTVNGRIYAQSAYNILTNGKENFTLNPTVNSIVINSNKMADSIEQRIANIIMSIHQIKISVRYKAALNPI